ncbi:hypothetical protein C8F04DRAFT_1100600 [Mycena alexandri]|uniref:Uncharacterized protein n=1 Tax=Mycena alexandri TaxID=1745969 RepID=A0AAD6SZN6_9AGAR|nr:hypothetical protein C8F04DRAFT_1100600 [Mycena alexandri]
MTKLCVGYMGSTEDEWRCARGRVNMKTVSIQDCLTQEIECNKVEDLHARLVKRHCNLTLQEKSQDISNYIRNVFQTINAINFSIEMSQLGAGPGGTTRKTAVYQAMHLAEGSSKTYTAWKREIEGRVTSWGKLRKVYLAFGPAIFLDPFWYPRNIEAAHRSIDFYRNLDALLELAPTGHLAEMLRSNTLALSTIMTLFFPAAAVHIMSFCDAHVPNIKYEADDDEL